MPGADASPTFVIVGHITRDVVPGGFAVGGTVTYAGRMARNLGERVGIVTSAADDVDFESALPGIQVSRVPAHATSTFENIYVGEKRQQYIRAVAEPLNAEAVPPGWREAGTALLSPLTNEVAPGVERSFNGSTLAATPQGWLRRWGPDGLVKPADWSTVVNRLARLDAVILSEEDVARDEPTIDMLRRAIPLLVVTRGARGGTLYRSGEPTSYPSFPANEVDPTGAGDGFAAAFLIQLKRTSDPVEACRFASAAASFVVEAPGADGTPTAEQVAQRLARGPRRPVSAGRMPRRLSPRSGEPGTR